MTESSAQAADAALVRAGSPGSGATAGTIGAQAGPAGEPARAGVAADDPQGGPMAAVAVAAQENPAGDAGSGVGAGSGAGVGVGAGMAELDAGTAAAMAADDEFDEDSPAGLTRGIWWAAAILPFLSVAGAVLCFAAGVLNTGGCQPEGSALCTGEGQWFTFVLPLMIAPLTAAVTAIAAIVLRKHRSSWLAAGYFVVFVSVLIGLASANSGTG